MSTSTVFPSVESFRFSFFSALIVCALTLLPCQARADDSRDIAVDQDIQRMQKAITAADYATLIDLMYQPIVQVGGGKDAMLAQVKAAAGQMTFSSFEAAKPYVYYSGTDNDYVVVTTHFILTVKGHQIDSSSYELGIKSHKGGNWQYVDGAGVQPQIRDKFFPDLPRIPSCRPYKASR